MTRHNLPVQPTPFIGRADELATLEGYLANPAIRLITVVGPGGMGKTRLALACAERQVSDTSSYVDGVCFVPLAPLVNPEQIVSAIAEGVGLALQAAERDPRSPRQQLLDYLREKHLLLILDNFEHLLGGVDVVADILTTAVAVQIIATSRERLHLQEEQVYPIQGLEFPDWETPEDALQYTAMQLFTQSAQRNDPHFAVKKTDLTYLTRICRLVQGMPLGIELAASWVDMLSLAEIVGEIQKNLDFLETDTRNRTDRHRSMRAVFDYSWQLLDDNERDLLPQLSVFQGGFSREAAQAIMNTSLRTLARLVNKSLLQFDKANGRYQLHELLRQYGAEKLAADQERATAVAQRHARYYTQFLVDRNSRLLSAEDEDTAAEIDKALDNIRRAFRWLIDHRDAVTLLPALNSFGHYLLVHQQHMHGFEFYQQLKQTFATPRTDSEKLAWVRAINWHGLLMLDLTIGDKSYVPALTRALTILDELDITEEEILVDRAHTCLNLGSSLNPGVQFTEVGLRYTNEAYQLYKKANFPWGAASALSLLSWAPFFRNLKNGHRIAKEKELEALRIAQTTGNHWLVQATLFKLCWRNIQAGELDIIIQYQPDLTREIESLRQNKRYRPQLADRLRIFASFLLYTGYPQEAQKTLFEVIAIYDETGQPVDEFFHMLRALYFMHCGQFEESYHHLQNGLELAQQRETIWAIGFGQILLGMYHLATNHLVEAEEILSTILMQAEKAEGINASDLAGMQANLALSLCRQERWDEAKPYLFQSLQTAATGHFFLPLVEVLPGIILLQARQGQFQQALKLYGVLLNIPYYANSKLFSEMRGDTFEAIVDRVPADIAEAAIAEGKQLELWATAVALRDELVSAGWGQIEEIKEEETVTAVAPATPLHFPVDRFQQQELLATGGHGEVYRGLDTTTGQQVVIKRLKPDLIANQPEMVERFLREADVLRQLDHPNIVKMLASQETDEGHIIVMEYMSGGSLRDLLAREKQLPIIQAVDIALELADALARAHHLGVIHRDIKPANVLLADDGSPRLTDFGIASLQQTNKRLTQTGVILGTMDYMSPEACESKLLDARSDIWSFGALLYEMLAGTSPFAADSMMSTLMGILTKSTPNLTEQRPLLPPSLTTLIEQMLVKNPAGRLSSMRRVAADLEEIRGQIP